MHSVLIVDDLAENRCLLKTILENAGYAVLTAMNGAEALTVALARPPDLVISDILMPVMDGFMLCRQWRQDPMLGRIPFIFLTASYTDAKDRQLAMSLGADRFITVPAEPEVIVQAVRQLLEGGGRPERTKPGVTPDPVCLRRYNEALIRKLENQLKDMETANIRLRARDGMKNSLLAKVAHELRTPLIAVRGYVKMINAGQSGPVSPLQRDQCGVMLGNIDLQFVVIDNLQHLANDDRRGLPLSYDTFPADKLIDEVGDLLRGKAREREITLRCEGSAVAVYGDRRQLLQVLTNLVDNAVKFTPLGGTVAISADANPTEVQFRVRDSGPGITAANQQHIFEQFYQADNPADAAPGGLGIGLSIAADLVSRQRGRITVTSEPGQGTLFTVILPRQQSVAMTVSYQGIEKRRAQPCVAAAAS